MTKRVSFDEVRQLLNKLVDKYMNIEEEYQKTVNKEFFDFQMTYVQSGGVWVWPDMETEFSLKNGKCNVRGPLAKLL